MKMKNGPQYSLTNFGSITGKTSPDDNRNTLLRENISVKVFLHCRKAVTLTKKGQVWPTETDFVCVCVCHNFGDIALCVEIKRFVVTSPDFVHPEIYGVSSYVTVGSWRV